MVLFVLVPLGLVLSHESLQGAGSVAVLLVIPLGLAINMGLAPWPFSTVS